MWKSKAVWSHRKDLFQFSFCHGLCHKYNVFSQRFWFFSSPSPPKQYIYPGFSPLSETVLSLCYLFVLGLVFLFHLCAPCTTCFPHASDSHCNTQAGMFQASGLPAHSCSFPSTVSLFLTNTTSVLSGWTASLSLTSLSLQYPSALLTSSVFNLCHNTSFKTFFLSVLHFYHF